MDRDKKVSFGFNKLQKKTFLQNKPVEHNKVELIECVEGQSIKIKDAPEVINAPLVIPIKNNKKSLFDRIIKTKQKDGQKEIPEQDNRPDAELTIEELAARELINDAKNRLCNNEPSKRSLILPFKEDKNIDEEREPTLDDYEKIPVSDYGIAMLRGMGWQEGMGIGKNPSKFEPAKPPEVRPKGLGLGASKIIKNKLSSDPACDKGGNVLILKNGTYGKIIAGSHKGDYCEVQGLDEEAGRVIVKTSLRGEILNMNEFLIVPVAKEEYLRNSKVLNNEKYEEYKKLADQRLENYRKSKDIKSEMRNESGSSRNYKQEKDRYFKSSKTNEHNSGSRGEEGEGTYSGMKYTKNKTTYRNKERDDYSSDDTDNKKNKKETRKDNDFGQRNRDRKEEETYRPSLHYQERRNKKNNSRSRHGRSNSSSS